MKSMDGALMELVEQGRVTALEAYQQANNKAKFENLKDNE